MTGLLFTLWGVGAILALVAIVGIGLAIIALTMYFIDIIIPPQV